MKDTLTLDTIHDHHSAFTRDQIARVIWSTITEPGDGEAGTLRQAHGAARALELVLGEDEIATDADVIRSVRDRILPRLTRDAVSGAMQAGDRMGAQLITPEHPHWPTRVNDLGAFAPFALWVRGDTGLLTDEATTAIVGARAATGYGEHVTMEMTAGLVERGHTIASGAAYGIDGMAHRAALASRGRTVAYLAGGVDCFYSSGHDALLTRIAEAGAVVSEVPCGTAPSKWRFLQRNRLIAANSNASVVVEAGYRSGSLNVAGHATALGRPLGAVPGPVTSAASAGCHRLIREYSATLVTNAEDVAGL